MLSFRVYKIFLVISKLEVFIKKFALLAQAKTHLLHHIDILGFWLPIRPLLYDVNLQHRDFGNL